MPPSRSTVSTADSPSWVAPTARCRSAKVATGCPFHATTVSPGRTPASCAGEDTSPDALITVVGTSAIVRDAVGAPIPIMAMAESTKQMSRFIIGPPSMTVIFFGAPRR